jgi:hypothetical protein
VSHAPKNDAGKRHADCPDGASRHGSAQPSQREPSSGKHGQERDRKDKLGYPQAQRYTREQNQVEPADQCECSQQHPDPEERCEQ